MPSVRRRRVAPFDRARRVAVVAAGLFVVLAGADRAPATRRPTRRCSARPAPDATGVFADGTPFDLSRRKGSWVVLNFFTSNCVPCMREHPELVEFAEQQAAARHRRRRALHRRRATATPRPGRRVLRRRGRRLAGRLSTTTAGSRSRSACRWCPRRGSSIPNGVVRGRVISEVTAELSARAPAVRGRTSERGRASRTGASSAGRAGSRSAFVVVGLFLAVGVTRDRGPQTEGDRIDASPAASPARSATARACTSRGTTRR